MGAHRLALVVSIKCCAFTFAAPRRSTRGPNQIVARRRSAGLARGRAVLSRARRDILGNVRARAHAGGVRVAGGAGDVAGRKLLVAGWNLLGLLDLANAIATGFLTSPSPLQGAVSRCTELADHGISAGVSASVRGAARRHPARGVAHQAQPVADWRISRQPQRTRARSAAL
jgi:hypothetical protein